MVTRILILLSTTKACSRALPCCTLARIKADQRLEPYAYQCYYNVQLVNQLAVRNSLVPEAYQCPHYQVNFGTVQVLEGPKKKLSIQLLRAQVIES